MSVMEGETATKELIKSRYSSPIVALSANAILEDIHRYKKIGMKGVIPKPIHRPQMIGVLDEFLKT